MSHFTGKHGLEDYEGQMLGVMPNLPIGGDVYPTHWPTTWAPSYDTDPPINYGEPIGPEPNWNAINEPMPGVPGIADPWMLSEPPPTTPETPNMQYAGPMLGDLQDAIMMYQNTPGGNSMPTLLTEPFTPFSPPPLNREPMWTTDVHMDGSGLATPENTQSWFQNLALALGAYELGAGLMETAPLWGSYAAGAAQMGGGYAMQGLAGLAGALGTAGAAVGGYNALSNAFGKKPHNQTVAQQGMCSCKQTQPEMSCEQKCQYGRYMSQKCKGCNGGKKKTYKRKYRASYSSNGRYSLGYGAGPINLRYNGTTKKKTGTRKPRAYAARKTMRQTARQTRKTTRTNARVARRANRRWRN